MVNDDYAPRILFVVLGIKVYETNENQLVMEPAIKWAGNPNIVIVVKISFLRIKIQV